MPIHQHDLRVHPAQAAEAGKKIWKYLVSKEHVSFGCLLLGGWQLLSALHTATPSTSISPFSDFLFSFITQTEAVRHKSLTKQRIASQGII